MPSKLWRFEWSRGGTIEIKEKSRPKIGNFYDMIFMTKSSIHLTDPTCIFQSSPHLTHPTSRFQSSHHLTNPTSTFQSSIHLTDPTSTFQSSIHLTDPTCIFQSSPHLTHPTSNSAFAPLESPKFAWHHHQTLDTYTIFLMKSRDLAG